MLLIFQAELLNGNALLKLPEGFGVFSKLVELNIDENPLLELPSDFGEHMTSLETLDLGLYWTSTIFQTYNNNN